MTCSEVEACEFSKSAVCRAQFACKRAFIITRLHTSPCNRCNTFNMKYSPDVLLTRPRALPSPVSTCPFFAMRFSPRRRARVDRYHTHRYPAESWQWKILATLFVLLVVGGIGSWQLYDRVRKWVWQRRFSVAEGFPDHAAYSFGPAQAKLDEKNSIYAEFHRTATDRMLLVQSGLNGYLNGACL